MNASNHELMTLIRATIPRAGEPPPTIDLWPRLEERLEARRASPKKLDWLLAGFVVGLLVGFPEAVLLVLYHL